MSKNSVSIFKTESTSHRISTVNVSHIMPLQELIIFLSDNQLSRRRNLVAH